MPDFRYIVNENGYMIYQNGQMLEAYDIVAALDGMNRDNLLQLRSTLIQALNSLDDLLGLERCVKTRRERRQR